MPRPPFTAAIFDMDGLLVDSERATLRAWTEAALALGVVLRESDYLQVVGKAAQDSHAILQAHLGGVAPFEQAMVAVRAALEEGEGKELLFPLKPGAAALLAHLQAAGIPCAVASSSRTDEIAHRLARVGVLQHFAAVAGGNEVLRGKPDPALYALAAARLGVEPAQCLAFEDSHNGGCAALAAGMGLVVVPDLLQPAPEVAQACVAVLGSLEEALPLLPRWFAPGASS
ncbi:HAD family phosphatase [Acidovorax sp. Root217]|uniref:HAD family hydrolase n=1 Tax=Acidovorax sp. Root217 TaxID=1736492 RepID=UPI00070D94F4|nr:HAD family phosphatase [Acidovorax sp. Root217]KRC27054.1 HAD family hydrolase [Acidovorax sp. Root217]